MGEKAALAKRVSEIKDASKRVVASKTDRLDITILSLRGDALNFLVVSQGFNLASKNSAHSPGRASLRRRKRVMLCLSCLSFELLSRRVLNVRAPVGWLKSAV